MVEARYSNLLERFRRLLGEGHKARYPLSSEQASGVSKGGFARGASGVFKVGLRWGDISTI